MAALYLHHALFSDDTSPPPTVAWMSHDRHASSLSSTTLRTTFDYSHPTEPLLQPDGVNAAAAAYADLLSQQPGHPSEPRASWMSGLTLQPGPLTTSEQKRVREQISRRRLRRSRRWIGITFGVIGAVSSRLRTASDLLDRKSTRLNSSHSGESRMPSSA